MQKNDCTRNCWIAGAVIGLLVWIFTSGIGHTSFMGGLFLALVAGVLMGLFLRWALCEGTGSAADGRDHGPVRATPSEPSDPPAPTKPMHLAPRSETAPRPGPAAAQTAAPVAVAPVPPPAPAKPAPANSAPVTAAAPAPEKEPVRTEAKAEPAKAKAPAKPKAAEKPARKAAAKPATKPAAKPDDLKQIKGVGPKLEKLLHDNGVTRFAQIAGWDDGQIDIFAEKIGSMGGRIRSDDWVAQARILATGGETEFSARVEKGDVYE